MPLIRIGFHRTNVALVKIYKSKEYLTRNEASIVDYGQPLNQSITVIPESLTFREFATEPVSLTPDNRGTQLMSGEIQISGCLSRSQNELLTNTAIFRISSFSFNAHNLIHITA